MQIKLGEAYTYDRSQAGEWCFAKRAEGFPSRFSARKVKGGRRLYTVRWFAKKVGGLGSPCSVSGFPA